MFGDRFDTVSAYNYIISADGNVFSKFGVPVMDFQLCALMYKIHIQ